MNNNNEIPKEVRRMSRLELLEVLVDQGHEIERLKADKEDLERELKRVRSQMRSVGTVDEAVGRLYEVIAGNPAAAAAITPEMAKAAAEVKAPAKPAAKKHAEPAPVRTPQSARKDARRFQSPRPVQPARQPEPEYFGETEEMGFTAEINLDAGDFVNYDNGYDDNYYNNNYNDGYSDNYDSYDDSFSTVDNNLDDTQGLAPLDSWEEEGEFVEFI